MAIAYNTSIVRNGLVLHLDSANIKSYPGSLGDEIVTNNVITIADGTTFNVFRDATQNLTLSICNVVSGKTYVIEYLVTSYTGTTSASFRINNSSANMTPSFGVSDAGRFKTVFTATASGTLSLNGDNAGTNLLVDYVSVREILNGTSTTWYDLSGNSNHGTMSSIKLNAPTFGFDAISDYVTIPHNSSLNFSSAFTVSTWLRINSFSTSAIYNIISKKPSYNNTQKGWSCQYDYRTVGVLQYRNNDGTVLNDSTPTTSVNNSTLLNQTTNYVNCVWTINQTAISFYINGTFNSTVTATYTNTDTTSDVYIGKTLGSIGDVAPLMDVGVVKLYNRVLSANEIKQNFEAIRGRYGI